VRPPGLPANRHSPLVEIVFGLPLLGGLTLLFLPAYSPVAKQELEQRLAQDRSPGSRP
jgi:hypothetical protein